MGWGLSSSSILMDKYYFEPPFNGWGGVYPHPPWVYHLLDHDGNQCRGGVPSVCLDRALSWLQATFRQCRGGVYPHPLCVTQCRGGVYPHPPSATVTYSLSEAVRYPFNAWCLTAAGRGPRGRPQTSSYLNYYGRPLTLPSRTLQADCIRLYFLSEAATLLCVLGGFARNIKLAA